MFNSRKPGNRAAKASFACEALEQRRMLAVFSVSGTAAADIITVTVGGGTVVANVNGNLNTQPDLFISGITIDGQGGADTINIISDGTDPITVNAGAGDDSIRITPSSMNMDSITAGVTVNGDGDDDTLTLFDQNNAALTGYELFSGNTIRRDGSADITYGSSTEQIVIDGGSGQSNFGVLDPPAASVDLNGSGGSDQLELLGQTLANATISPTSQFDGSVDYAAETINYTSVAAAFASGFTNFTYITPAANDVISIGAVGSGTGNHNQLTGTSGGTTIITLEFTGLGELKLNTALNDGAAGDDSVSVGANLVGAVQLDLIAGSGSNALSVSNAAARVAVGGGNVDVTADGSLADLTLNASPTLRSLIINNGAIVDFVGSGVVLNTQSLFVANGTGNIDLATSQTGNVNAGANNVFGIGAGHALNKQGGGALNIMASQNHGAGSTLFVQAGTLGMFSDAAVTPAARTLTVSSSATTNFFSNEHLAGLNVAAGTTTLTPSGSRVLVTNALTTGSEGGALDLKDNDLILDYSGSSPLDGVRQLITHGYDGGAWDGLGVNSSTAAAAKVTGLGYAEATDLFGAFPATFSGQQVDSTSILLKYTWYGDSNLDGQVDVTDLGALATNWQLHPRLWIQGDLNYDQTVDVTDLGRLATNWQAGVGHPLVVSQPQGTSSSIHYRPLTKTVAEDVLSPGQE